MNEQNETHPALAREDLKLICLLLLVIQSQATRVRYFQAEDLRKAEALDQAWRKIAQLERGERRRAA